MPRVSAATNDALSAIGLRSEHCAEHTAELLVQLCTITQNNREAAGV